jgi:uncharacterized protein involved in outer membrane biogenesis
MLQQNCTKSTVKISVNTAFNTKIETQSCSHIYNMEFNFNRPLAIINPGHMELDSLHTERPLQLQGAWSPKIFIMAPRILFFTHT